LLIVELVNELIVALAGNLIGKELVTRVAFTGESILLASVQYSTEGWDNLRILKLEDVEGNFRNYPRKRE
jgi:hypothetical protein